MPCFPTKLTFFLARLLSSVPPEGLKKHRKIIFQINYSRLSVRRVVTTTPWKKSSVNCRSELSESKGQSSILLYRELFLLTFLRKERPITSDRTVFYKTTISTWSTKRNTQHATVYLCFGSEGTRNRHRGVSSLCLPASTYFVWTPNPLRRGSLFVATGKLLVGRTSL